MDAIMEVFRTFVENIKNGDYVGAIIYAVPIILLIVVLVIIGVKKVKACANLKSTNGLYKILKNKIPELIIKIETVYPKGNGDLKKEYVMEQLKAYCTTEKIDYKEDELDEMVELIVELMNTKKIGEQAVKDYLKNNK